VGETANSSNQNSGIDLERNAPVALIVGTASFLGSHLADKLLKLNIQVVGVDNFSTGKKENLEDAARNKSFHLINSDVEDLHLSVTRLDYIFILAKIPLQDILEIAKKYNSKMILISSIELYDRNASSNTTGMPLQSFTHSGLTNQN
jgi:UDP-glucose 4-epimerase